MLSLDEFDFYDWCGFKYGRSKTRAWNTLQPYKHMDKTYIPPIRDKREKCIAPDKLVNTVERLCLKCDGFHLTDDCNIFLYAREGSNNT